MVTRTTPQKRPLDKRLPEKRRPSEPTPPPDLPDLSASSCGEPISKVDLAWLRMDTPANLMMILGVWTIKPSLSYATVCQRLEQRLRQYPRFAQRVQWETIGARWVVDPDFHIQHHVVREHLPVANRALVRDQRRLVNAADGTPVVGIGQALDSGVAPVDWPGDRRPYPQLVSAQARRRWQAVLDDLYRSHRYVGERIL